MNIISKTIELGQRIKAIRLKLGKNQAAFGKMLNPPAPKSAVSRWEHGRNAPVKERLKQIAALGNVSTDYLRFGSNVHKVLTTLNKVAQNIQPTKEEQKAIDIFRIETNEGLKAWKKIGEQWKASSYKRINKEQAIIKKHPLSVFDLNTYGNFLSLFNLIRLNGTEDQRSDFDTLINGIWQTATGRMKYDKNDLLSVLDPFMKSLPIKKDDHKSGKDKKQS